MIIADVMGGARERFNDWIRDNLPPIIKDYRKDYNFDSPFFDPQAEQLNEDIENDIDLHEEWFNDLRGRLQEVEPDEYDAVVDSWFDDLTDTVTNTVVESWSVTQSRSQINAHYRGLIDAHDPELSKEDRLKAETRLSDVSLDDLINHISFTNPLIVLGISNGSIVDAKSSEVLNLVTPLVSNKVEAFVPDFYKENHITNDQMKQPETVNTVIKLCVNSVITDLSSDCSAGLDEDGLDNDVTQYVTENLSTIFIRAKMRQTFNFEVARDVATNLLLDNIRAHNDYAEAHDPSWWLDKIHRVPENMSIIRVWDSAEQFVNGYVPDWENED